MKHIIIGTAGHIDHGKTSLIKLLTGIDCDTHKEEKARGITINLGFSYLNLPDGSSVGIVDVPGHKDFINTMVGGACGIDMVLLIIAADSGIMPQTIEHFNIISALGIKKGIVVLTKTDLVDDELVEMAKYEILTFLEKTPFKDAPLISVSSLTGIGKEELINAISELTKDIEEKEDGHLFRMYIDRIFTVKGMGSVVTGSVMSGGLSMGKDVFLLPGNQKLRVRSLERHGIAIEKVVAGDRAAINLIGLKKEDFERGMLLCNKEIKYCTMVDAYIKLFDNAQKLSLWSTVTFISGTFECTARMHALNRDEVLQGQDAIVQLHLAKPAVLLNKDKFIIRNTSADITLGGGYIIDAGPLHHRKRTKKLLDYLNELSQNLLSGNSLEELIKIELKKEFRPFTVTDLAERTNTPINAILAEIQKENTGFSAYWDKDIAILIDKTYDNIFQEKIVKALNAYHSKNLLSYDGLDLAALSGKLGFSKIKIAKAYIENILLKMKNEGLVDMSNGTWIIAGYTPNLDKRTLDDIKSLEEVILAYQDEKPAIAEIEEKAAIKKIPAHKVKVYLAHLAREGAIRYFQNDFMHMHIIEKNKKIILEKIKENPKGISHEVLKENLGGTKRFRGFLINLLEADNVISITKGADSETLFVLNNNI